MRGKGKAILLVLIISMLAALYPAQIHRVQALDNECVSASVAPDVTVSSRFLELLFGKKQIKSIPIIFGMLDFSEKVPII